MYEKAIEKEKKNGKVVVVVFITLEGLFACCCLANATHEIRAKREMDWITCRMKTQTILVVPGSEIIVNPVFYWNCDHPAAMQFLDVQGTSTLYDVRRTTNKQCGMKGVGR